MTTTKTKRRFLRFSVRTLLIVLTIGCVALGWRVERVRKQREAVTWVHQMGGFVKYDATSGPIWLRKQLGTDFFGDVTHVFLLNTLSSDVSPLAKLTRLEYLYFSGTNVSDLSPLTGLTRLRSLNLVGTPVHDVTPLAGLAHLERLDLDGTRVSEDAVAQLRRTLPQCRIRK